MPSKIVDLSARSEIIEQEPFGLHFWECTPMEFLNYLLDPRATLESMGINIPKRCRIETVIENHDWMSTNTGKFRDADGGIICNVGHGDTGIEREIYRVISYGHTHESIGKFKKTLLHARDEQERKSKARAKPKSKPKYK
jgi:hypothetical protein